MNPNPDFFFCTWHGVEKATVSAENLAPKLLSGPYKTRSDAENAALAHAKNHRGRISVWAASLQSIATYTSSVTLTKEA
jgi:hypothetical protein